MRFDFSKLLGPEEGRRRRPDAEEQHERREAARALDAKLHDAGELFEAQILLRCEAPAKGRAKVAMASLLAAFRPLGAAALARDIIERSLAAEWSAPLVSLYGVLPALDAAERAEEARRRTEKAEKWLHERPEDPQLLATLGRLCAHAELWGKAQSYLEAGVWSEETRAAQLELARLAGRTARSPRQERKASLRWQIIWSEVISPHFRWLPGRTARSRFRISILSFGLASVFMPTILSRRAPLQEIIGSDSRASCA